MAHLLNFCRRTAEAPDRAWALATLVRTQGSTYRKPGAQILIDDSGDTLGVLSGGCLEAEIAVHGQQVMQTGQPVLLHYDTRRLYGCDGELDILVEPVPPARDTGNLLTILGERLNRRETCQLRTRFLTDSGAELLGTTLVTDRETDSESADGVLLHAPQLPVRLLLMGSGPELAPLLCQSACLGWVYLTCARPDELKPDFKPDARTAAVIMTHNLGRDYVALSRLLPLGLPYVALLGPRKRQAQLLNQLEEAIPVESDWLDSLYSPAGLDIGSDSPEEIALAIVAEISAVLSQRSGGFLRNRRGAIHAPAAQALVLQAALR